MSSVCDTCVKECVVRDNYPFECTEAVSVKSYDVHITLDATEPVQRFAIEWMKCLTDDSYTIDEFVRDCVVYAAWPRYNVKETLDALKGTS